MKQLAIFAILTALWGCRAAQQEAGIPITFAPTEQTPSKSNALTAGEIAGIFATTDGTDRYLMENTPFAVEADGRSLSATPAVYYPEAKQAINFYAYLPFGGTWDRGVGTFSVPSDQTTATALKQADLCWATASSTPVAAPVALAFRHQMARLLITTNEPTEKIAIPNAFSGGILDIKTGAFTNTLKSEVFTTGTELILPAQTVTRLVLTVSGVEYTFEGSIALETAKTTSINLTLNPTTKTATLSGSSTTDWTTSASAGAPTEMAVNLLTAAWTPAHPRTTEVDKIVLTINHNNTSTDYTIPTGITQTDGTFRFAFAAHTLSYPYRIEKIHLYKANELIQTTDRIAGATVYKSGVYTFGVNGRPINPPTDDQIFYYDGYGTPIYWTKGYLVAKAGTDYECMVGEETDMGLYFQFGSLIGWSGAKTEDGVGFITDYRQALATKRRVHPIECTTPPTTLSATAYNDLDHYYFGLQSAPYNGYADIRQYPGLAIHQYAPKGVGDPCSYYLGEPWRLPTDVEQWALWRRPRASGTGFGWATGYEWNGTGYIGSGGVQFYNTSRTDNTKFIAAGSRSPNWFSGTYTGANTAIMSGGWASCTYNQIYGSIIISAGPVFVNSQGHYVNGVTYDNLRYSAASTRCVRSI